MKRELLEPAVSNGANGRLPGGRFAPGNKTGGRFGPGNKAAKGRRAAAHEWHEAAREAVTPSMLRDIFRAAAARALRGDIAAAKFVAEYTVGKPAQRIDLFRDSIPPMDPDDPDFGVCF